MTPGELTKKNINTWPHAICVIGHHDWVSNINDKSVTLMTYHFPHIGLDQASELRSATRTRLPEGKHQVSLVVTSAIQLDAQNALLKSIEEPASGHRIILVLPSLDGILDTLLSRMVIISSDGPFRSGNRSLVTWLKKGTLDRLKESEGWLKDKKDPLGRDELRGMLVELETALYKEAQKHASWFKLLELLKEYRHYLTTAGVSSKYLLELLALALPEPGK